ncbi:hypothetical protein H0X09_00565 [Candidatus Saccharibacteria bacterium]|nr:hypothetical protein [Candidatus Saccharibacteria bacterium]
MQTNGLQRYKEFKFALASYRISERAKSEITDLRLVLLIAPTSGGRNTIIRRLLTDGGYHYIVSDTTRKPRINDGILEQNGREYWFRTEEEMLADLQTGEYLEAELIHGQQVSGISIRELKKAKKQNKIGITDIDLDGVHNVIKVKPDTIIIMILPPSFDEWQRRIARRGHMSGQEYIRRLQTADKIFSDGIKNNFYHFLISENVEQSASIINSIVEGGRNPHQDRGRSLLSQLQSHLQEKLLEPSK